jgi:low temperature requirement protein LtrA
VQNELARDAWSYLHFVMVAGIVLFALGVKKSLGHLGDPLDIVPATALCAGAALYYVGHVALRWRVAHAIALARVATAVALVAVIPLAATAPALAALAAVTVCIWIGIAWEPACSATSAARRAPRSTSASTAPTDHGSQHSLQCAAQIGCNL